MYADCRVQIVVRCSHDSSRGRSGRSCRSLKGESCAPQVEERSAITSTRSR
jgi:hypothetical protein